MQKANTVLLVIVLAVVLGLWFRPQPGRYRDLDGEGSYLLDTATGTIVLMKVSDEVRKHIKENQAREKAEKKAGRESWLKENCPDILAGTWQGDSGSLSLHPRRRELVERRREECEEWMKAHDRLPGSDPPGSDG